MKENKVELYKLLKAFKIKVLGKQIGRFGYQKLNSKGFGYDWVTTREPDLDDLDQHFTRPGIDVGNYKKGSLAFLPTDLQGFIHRIVIDADNQQLKDICYSKVIPKYQELGIDYIVEHGGDNNDRCHLSFLTHAKVEVTKPFMRQLMAEMGEPIFPGADEIFLEKKVELEEVYGANKTSTLIRAPYGFHLKRGRRFPLEYKGEILDDHLAVINTFLSMGIVTDEFMKSYMKPDFFPDKNERPKWVSDKLVYDSLNLPLPVQGIPAKLQPIFHDCQALNGMLEDAYEASFIDERGDTHHNAGLVFADMANYHDHKFDSTDGKTWFFNMLGEVRTREAKSHSWWKNADRYMMSCEKMSEKFGRCDGCPFRSQVTNPSAFMFGQKIKKTVGEFVRAYSLDEIRENHFPKVKQMIIDMIRNS